MTAERMKELRNEKAVPFDDQRRPNQGIENFHYLYMEWCNVDFIVSPKLEYEFVYGV